MARSLQVEPEEHVTTHPLLIGFLLVAAVLLTVGMVASVEPSDAFEADAAVGVDGEAAPVPAGG